jgi:hypothetical protein
MKIYMIIALAASNVAAQVILGTNSFDVVFEATNLTSATQSRLIADINLCRQLWTNSVVHLGMSATDSYIEEMSIVGRPYFNEISVPREIVTNSVGALSLLVNKQASDAYLKAFEFADANSNITRAADAFVEAFSNSNFVCNTMTEYLEYFLIPTGMQVDIQDEIEGFKEYEYSKPSVMSFGYYKKGPEPTPGVSSNLFMKLQYRSMETGMELIDQLPCIWHDGRWKFYYWDI